MPQVYRIHHVSALGGNAQEIVDFHRNVLGIELIKATVNYANKNMYHLFFANHGADSMGAMTYFDFSGHRDNPEEGGGQAGVTAYRVPKTTLPYWKERLESHGIKVKENKLFLKDTLEFKDNYGIPLAIVEGEEHYDSPMIYDFHGIELKSTDYKSTADHLEQFMGMNKVDETDDYIYFQTLNDYQLVIIKKVDRQRRMIGIGGVDHVAFEIGDKNELLEWRHYLTENGFENTDLTNQNFKKATYYREPGRVRFELITKGLGDMISPESNGELGNEVVIPSHFKNEEEEIRKNLAPLKL